MPAEDAPTAPPLGDASKNRKHRKDKHHWKIAEFKPEHMPGPLTEESSFATLFPRYRELYIKEVWPALTKILAGHGIACELNLIEGSMLVRTTRKTYDPYIILKARDLIKLLARSVPLANAAKVLEDGSNSDIIKIGNIVTNKERFIKRRQRLLGPSGNTLKAIELLTQCYVLVQGNTVSVIGSYKGLKEARRIVIDCMKNVHPIYRIKELMIKRELAKDPALKSESWDRFLPKFRKTSAKPKAKVEQKKKSGDLFPPLQAPRQEDLDIESGVFFTEDYQKRLREKKQRKQLEKQDAA